MRAKVTVGSFVRWSLRATARLRAIAQRAANARVAVSVLFIGLCVGPGASVAQADLKEIASVPGVILDASPQRVLYATTSPPALKLYAVETGQTTTVPVPAGTTPSPAVNAGHLIDGGVLFVASFTSPFTYDQLYEWRNGQVTALDGVSYAGAERGWDITVAGDYALWRHNSTLQRRNVATGQTVTVSESQSGFDLRSDVSANGDVVYASAAGSVFRWRNGSSVLVSGERATWPVTDGVNIVYRTYTATCCPTASIVVSDGQAQVAFDTFTDGTLITKGPEPRQDYRASGGWVAFTRPQTAATDGRPQPLAVWTRDPQGTVVGVSPPAYMPPRVTTPQNYRPLTLRILGLSPTGQVVYDALRADGGVSTNLAFAGRQPFPLASSTAFSSRREVFWSGGHWYLVRDGSLARLDTDTAILAQPPEASSDAGAVFEFTSTAQTVSYRCRLDGGSFVPCSSPQQYSGVADGPHTFSVIATDTATGEQDTSPASAAWTIDTSAPNPAAPTAPADQAAVATQRPTLSWAAASDAGSGLANYEVWIDDTKAATLAADKTSFVPASSLGEGDHRWRVVATDRVGRASTSGTRSFTVDTLPPSAPRLQSPADGQTLASVQPVLTWEASVDVGSGLAGYDITIDAGPPTRVPSTATSLAPASELPDGAHTWSVTAFDRAGNATASSPRAFTIDTRPPSAVLSIVPNPALTGQSITFDASGSTAMVGTIVHYEWDLDGDGSYETDSGATPTVSRGYAANGRVPVGLRVTDTAGRTAVATAALEVTPQPLPGPPGVTINNGARYTNNPLVTITAVWPLFATAMLVSNDGGFAGATATPVSSHFAWHLPQAFYDVPSRLPQTVYVRFIGGLAGNETYQDDIILDLTDPKVTSAAVATTTSAAKAKTARKSARKRTIRLRIKAKDTISGLAAVQVTQNRRKPGTWQTYRTQPRLRTAKSSPIYVRVRDRAGNPSPWKRAKQPPKR